MPLTCYFPVAAPKINLPRDARIAPPPLVVIKSSPHVHSPTPLPATSSNRHHARMNITSPGPSYLVPPPASADHRGSVYIRNQSDINLCHTILNFFSFVILYLLNSHFTVWVHLLPNLYFLNRIQKVRRRSNFFCP